MDKSAPNTEKLNIPSHYTIMISLYDVFKTNLNTCSIARVKEIFYFNLLYTRISARCIFNLFTTSKIIYILQSLSLDVPSVSTVWKLNFSSQ
jgi:hypothetical protein